jgi:hypothetical protein
VISINGDQVKHHLAEVVRGTVEQTLQALLEAEADALCGRGVTSARAGAWTPARGTMHANCRRARIR